MADIYIKFGDKIKGESTDADHKEWCEVESFATGVMQPVSQQSGTGGRTSAGCSWQDFSLSKYCDNSSADLMMHCCTGEHIPKVEVHCVQSTTDRHQFLKYEMKNVIVSSYSVSGSGGGGKPMEQISCNCGEFKLMYTPITHDGKAGTEQQKAWSLEENKAA